MLAVEWDFLRNRLPADEHGDPEPIEPVQLLRELRGLHHQLPGGPEYLTRAIFFVGG